MSRTGVRRETSAGGVIVRCTPDGPRYLLILDAHDNWGFPKGHIDPGEGPEAAARREIAEEVALTELELHDALGVIDWHFRFRGRRIHKFCHYFLFSCTHGEAVPQAEEGIARCAWCALEDALKRLRFENAREMLRAAAARAAELCGGA